MSVWLIMAIIYFMVSASTYRFYVRPRRQALPVTARITDVTMGSAQLAELAVLAVAVAANGSRGLFGLSRDDCYLTIIFETSAGTVTHHLPSRAFAKLHFDANRFLTGGQYLLDVLRQNIGSEVTVWAIPGPDPEFIWGRPFHFGRWLAGYLFFSALTMGGVMGALY